MSPMSPRFRRWWPWLKWLFVIAVVVGICWHLMSILQSEELTEGDDARTPAGILWDAIRSASTPGLILSWYTAILYIPRIRHGVAVGRAAGVTG